MQSIVTANVTRRDEVRQFTSLVGPLSELKAVADLLASAGMGGLLHRLVTALSTGALLPCSFLLSIVDCVSTNALSCYMNIRRRVGGDEAAETLRALLGESASAGYTGARYQQAHHRVLSFFALLSTLHSGTASIELIRRNIPFLPSHDTLIKEIRRADPNEDHQEGFLEGAVRQLMEVMSEAGHLNPDGPTPMSAKADATDFMVRKAVPQGGKEGQISGKHHT